MANFSIMWQGSPDMAKLAYCGLMLSTVWSGSTEKQNIHQMMTTSAKPSGWAFIRIFHCFLCEKVFVHLMFVSRQPVESFNGNIWRCIFVYQASYQRADAAHPLTYSR